METCWCSRVWLTSIDTLKGLQKKSEIEDRKQSNALMMVPSFTCTFEIMSNGYGVIRSIWLENQVIDELRAFGCEWIWEQGLPSLKVLLKQWKSGSWKMMTFKELKSRWYEHECMILKSTFQARSRQMPRRYLRLTPLISWSPSDIVSHSFKYARVKFWTMTYA